MHMYGLLAYLYVYMFSSMYTWECTCGSQRVTSGVFLDLSLPLEVEFLTCLGAPSSESLILGPELTFWIMDRPPQLPSIYVGADRPNSFSLTVRGLCLWLSSGSLKTKTQSPGLAKQE